MHVQVLLKHVKQSCKMSRVAVLDILRKKTSFNYNDTHSVDVII